MANQELIEQLKQMLKELFQFENNDLDFGIYRIINIKRNEISEFIETELFTIIEEEFEKQEDLENQETSEEFLYDSIIDFFSRYYDKGDFISKRRYSKTNKYVIPYNGEEVYLHWANNDQYYVKTAENFMNYACKVGNFKLKFGVVNEEVDLEKGNIKEFEKKFFIFYDVESLADTEINLHFSYRGLTNKEKEEIRENIRNKTKTKAKKPKITMDDVNDHNTAKIVQSVALSNPESIIALKKKHVNLSGELSERSELKWHLDKYSKKNTADYFIHKDLKRFLIRELDFYIKNEILDINTIISSEGLINKLKIIKVFRQVSLKVITFLTQIEEFQKKLWEKRKFILSTDYCVTIDYIDDEFFPEILKNKEQLEEWKNLYNFDIKEEIKKNKAKINNAGKNQKDLAVETLKNNLTLLIDTKYFSRELKYKFLSRIKDLDEKITGILINSDNFHALNLLKYKYEGKIAHIFIDPPYNTGNDEFIYKDSFQHSSWLSFMENRISLSKCFLLKEGLFSMSLNDVEQANCRLLLDSIFSQNNFLANIIWWKRSGRNNNAKLFSDVKDFVLLYRNSNELSLLREPKALNAYKGYSNPDNDPRGIWTSISYVNPATKEERPNLVYKIENPFTGELVEHETNAWKHSRESNKKHIAENKLYWGLNGSNTYPRLKLFATETGTMVPMDVWDQKYADTNDSATRVLKNLFGTSPFSNPKPPKLVERLFSLILNGVPLEKSIYLDFFAGSGSTGQAVLQLNKRDDGNRKFILIEMGIYFNDILLPRIKKNIFSENWRDGKPQDNDGIKRQILKYQYLEQYEDTLKNIDFKIPNTLALNSKDYKIKYMLNFETKESKVLFNIDLLDNPFEYELQIEVNNEIKNINIDIVETFNYLAGIFVDRIIREVDNNVEYIIVKGHVEEKNIIVIWRDKTEFFDPRRDKEFIEKNIINNEEYDQILVNGSSLIENSISLDDIFKKSILGL